MASQSDDSLLCIPDWSVCFSGGSSQKLIPLGQGSSLGDGSILSVTIAKDPSSSVVSQPWIISILCYTDSAYTQTCPDWVRPNSWNGQQTYLIAEFATSTSDNKYWTAYFTDTTREAGFDGSFPVRFNSGYYYQLLINDNSWNIGAYGSSGGELYWVLRGIKDEPACSEQCYSNVLFLPGLKGSVLKIGADTVWPPTILSNDIQQLALTENGESVHAVQVDGIINTFYNVPIYRDLSVFMDSLVTGGTINAWAPLSYDWRFSPERILADGIQTPSGTLQVIDKIENLAADSRSGKVTLVAHSMGGLLGKVIIKKLEEQGKEGLIDSFVMVGVPQLGTPQAAAALLHGDSEAIPGKFWPAVIASPDAVRMVAQNFQSAYDLLPSQRYFAEVPDPPIVFDSSALFTNAWRAQWGQALNSFAEFAQFITGQGVTRTDPPQNILNVPEILRPALVQKADDFHAEYDNYIFPPAIRVVRVAGWGVPTMKAVEYTKKHLQQTYEPVFTIEGDGTVVYPSAISQNEDAYYFDINIYRKAEKDTRHVNLLNKLPIQNLISNVIERLTIEETQFLSKIKPEPASLTDHLVVSAHSPVILGVYDAAGRFTGIDPNQNPALEALTISEDIPGSTFQSFGESQYIFVPKQGIYTFVFKAIGTGPTTVEIENVSNDTTTSVVTYSDMPVTTNTKATFVVNSATPTTAEIEVDINGDNQTDDIVVADGAELTLEKLLAQLKTKIQSLDSKLKLKKDLLSKVQKIEKKIAKQKQNKASKTLMSLGKKVLKKIIKSKISDADAQEILRLLDEIERKI
ncbi:MAG: hypothetical protein KBD50_02480 [Candidatus Pacebacteria bacterium]|nr:hypothetical protein [Candidatus Paceibacterota bacterium]